MGNTLQSIIPEKHPFPTEKAPLAGLSSEQSSQHSSDSHLDLSAGAGGAKANNML